MVVIGTHLVEALFRAIPPFDNLLHHVVAFVDPEPDRALVGLSAGIALDLDDLPWSLRVHHAIVLSSSDPRLLRECRGAGGHVHARGEVSECAVSGLSGWVVSRKEDSRRIAWATSPSLPFSEWATMHTLSGQRSSSESITEFRHHRRVTLFSAPPQFRRGEEHHLVFLLGLFLVRPPFPPPTRAIQTG